MYHYYPSDVYQKNKPNLFEIRYVYGLLCIVGPEHGYINECHVIKITLNLSRNKILRNIKRNNAKRKNFQ